jgi:hypothetical protein
MYMSNTLEKTAKANIKLLYPEAYADGSFAKRVIGAYTSTFDEPGMIIRDSWNLGVVPDCYFHFYYPKDDEEGGVDYFIVCEVEDTNPLTEDKLSTYGHIWDHMYCNLEVWSFNRYGQFTTAHNLCYWYHHGYLGSENTNPMPSVDLNMKKPLFPDNEKFFERYSQPSTQWKRYKPWSEERRLRLFKNTKDLKKSYTDRQHAWDYWDQYGKLPLGFEEKYPDEVVYDENGKARFLD